MGVMNHNTVVATTWSESAVTAFHGWLEASVPYGDRDMFMEGPNVINGFRTVCMSVDGSKEGWDESDAGDVLRAAFIEHLNDFGDDGYTPWEWVEVGFGEFGQAVLGGNNRNRHDDLPYACPDHIRPYTPRSDDEDSGKGFYSTDRH